MKLFLQKNAKFSKDGAIRPETPVSLAAGGFAPKSPKQSPLIANLWLRAWSIPSLASTQNSL